MNRFCFVGSVLVAVALLAPMAPAWAAVRPVKLTGSGDGVADWSDHAHPSFAFAADVQGSPLGNNATMTGSSMVLGPDPTIQGNELVVGEVTFQTAKGELLHATIAASNGETTGCVGTLTWTGGTGKFTNASGSASFVAHGSHVDGNSMFTFTITVDGTVN